MLYGNLCWNLKDNHQLSYFNIMRYITWLLDFTLFPIFIERKFFKWHILILLWMNYILHTECGLRVE